MMLEEMYRQLDAHLQVIEQMKKTLAEPICACVSLICSTFKKGGKIIVMGNGGSAADAQHFAAEMIGRFMLERKALPAIALTTDSSVLTSIGNDYGFESVFARQIEALAAPNDLVVGISTSGNASNVINAIRAAKAKGVTTVGLIGCEGGEMCGLVDLALTVPSLQTPRIQEAHTTIIHLLCDLVERELFA